MIRITKHRNNKLYIPEVSRYTNLSEIKEMVQSGERILVTDDVSKDDVTAHILAQVLAKTGAVPADRIADLIRSGQ